MNLADYLAVDAVAYRSDLKSKKRALEELSRLLAQSARYVSDAEVFTGLISREKLGSTALGAGVAIPHGRLDGLDRPVAAFMRIEGGVDYEADDGTPADLIFGLLVPKAATQDHLKLLAAIAEMLQDDARVAAIRASEDPAEIHRLLTSAQTAD